MATGKIFVHDCTAVTALDLFLFGAEPQVLHAQHRVLIDNWMEMRISPRTAVLFKALRKQIFELMATRIDDAGGGGGGGESLEGAGNTICHAWGGRAWPAISRSPSLSHSL